MSVAKNSKPLSPKKLEIQQRPGWILNIARHILVEEGYAFLTIDRIAKELNCSRPPIYESFASREDIVMGLAIEDVIQRWTLIKKAMTFNGSSREKISAMSAIFDKMYPEHLKILVILQPNSIRQRASEKKLNTLEEYEARAFDLGVRVVEEAIEVGDLILPEGFTAAMVAYSMLCITFGGSTFESRYPYWPIQQRDFDRELAFKWGASAMLDGFGWKPLSHEHDYRETIERARIELKAEEMIRETENAKPSTCYGLTIPTSIS